MLRVGRWEGTSLRGKMIQPIAVDHGYLEKLPVAVDIHGQRRTLCFYWIILSPSLRASFYPAADLPKASHPALRAPFCRLVKMGWCVGIKNTCVTNRHI